jgi:PAS domain S-box-containing protein
MTSAMPDLSVPPSATGDTAVLIQEIDWASSALGPSIGWPASLHAAIRLILAAPTPIVLMCGEQGVLIYNDAYAAFSGERHPSLLGQPVEQAWPEIADWNRQILDRGLRGESLAFENHHFELHRPGLPDDAWMNLYYSPLLDEQQRSHGMMCIVVETTAQVLAERQRASAEAGRREANERLDLALSAGAVIGTWVWNVDTDNLRGDERFAQAFGLDPAQVAQGLQLSDYSQAVHPDDRARIRAHISECLVAGGAYRVEYRVRRQDGQYHWVEGNGFCELGQDHRVLRFPGVLIDIDTHKKTELALRNLTQSLEERVANAIQQRMQTEEQLRQVQKMEAIGQLTGGIAHDFNNILAAILGSLELSQLKLRKGKHQEVAVLLESAVASANRGASLTHRLLAFARRQALDMRPTNANTLVYAVNELVGRTLGEQIRLETRLTPEPWLIRTDAHQLENALINLVLNARDAMPNGGLLRIETDNRSLDSEAAGRLGAPTGDYLCIRVSDNGIGMDAEITKHVFEPFFTTKPIGQGTGLGLPMVYGFMKQAGGYLQLDSEPGRGTRIALYLPRMEPSLMPELPTPQPPAALGSGEHVLLVEDDPVVRLLMAEALTELGYRLLQAGNGREALKILESGVPVDLLLTDVGLPGMSGKQLADEARRLRADLPVLFATGYAHDAQARSGNLGARTAILSKPFAIEQLSSKLRALLNS